MNDKQPISEILRQAVNKSGMSFLALENATGVLRQTLMPFARGERSISLAAADKLAVYFGLTLGQAKPPKRKGT